MNAINAIRVRILLFLALIVLGACSRVEGGVPNILFIMADDLGIGDLSSHGANDMRTPHIDRLMASGCRFSNAYANCPVCSPTRAAFLTGRYPDMVGVPGVIRTHRVNNWGYLSAEATTLPQVLKPAGYHTALIGKWHLGLVEPNTPMGRGFDDFKGFLGDMMDDYYNHRRHGVNYMRKGRKMIAPEGHATDLFSDWAAAYIKERAGQESPFFLFLSYNAPHTPFHAPPSNMHSQGNLPTYNNGLDPIPYYMAAIEAMDFQIGRLLDDIPEDERNNTIIIFIGDNGTPNQVAQNPYSSSTVKNTLYQGGVNVPMFISGNSVSRSGTDNNLITSTDLFATIAEITGSSTNEIHDSKSFKSLFSESKNIREYQYSELVNGADDEWTISNGTYKLIANAVGMEEMYNLVNDPYENSNLLNGPLSTIEQNAKSELEAELTNIRN